MRYEYFYVYINCKRRDDKHEIFPRLGIVVDSHPYRYKNISTVHNNAVLRRGAYYYVDSKKRRLF